MRAADRLANTLIAWLLRRGANGDALAVLERRLTAHPQFAIDPARIGRLSELAGMLASVRFNVSSRRDAD